MTKKPNNFSIKQWPEGERPREKLIQFGAELLTDAELLAILLRIGNEGASAIDMGRDLIARLGGLQGIDRAHAEDIRQIKGLGLVKTAQLKAAIYLFEPQDSGDRVPFDLNTFKYVQISQAAEIPGRLTPEIKTILEDAGAVLERETS